MCWRSTPGGSTRTSGSPTAVCRTPTSLRLVERFSRPDFDTLKYEVTIEDTGAYTRPWSERVDAALGCGRGIAAAPVSGEQTVGLAGRW